MEKTRPPPHSPFCPFVSVWCKSLLTQAAAYYDKAAAVSCVKTKGESYGDYIGTPTIRI